MVQKKLGILYQVIQRKIGIAWTLTGFQNLGHSKRQQANQVNVVRVQWRKRRQEAIQQEISSKLQKINEPGQTVQGIFVDTKSDDNFSHRDDVSQDGGLQHLDIEEAISLYQETQTETKDLSVLFPGQGEPLTYF